MEVERRGRRSTDHNTERSGSRGGRVFFRTCLVHCEDLTLDVLTVQAVDRGLRFGVIRELEEAKAFGLAGGALGRDVCRLQRSERNREIVQFLVRDLFGEIAYIDFHWSLLTLIPRRRHDAYRELSPIGLIGKVTKRSGSSESDLVQTD